MDFLEGLESEKQLVIKEQIERFKKLKEEDRRIIEPSDNLLLPKGTLIHGTSFNDDNLKSISNSGIITGQFFGIEEDGETYYCADFHKVPKDESIREYDEFHSKNYNDGRCPFGNKGKNSIAFLIYPDDRNKELLKYDCFIKDTEEGKVTRSMVNEKGLPYDDNTIMSSILFGVPSNFINGIVIGDNLISKENIERLNNLFPNVFIVRNTGEIIYKPNENKEITDLRIESVIKSVEIKKMQEEKQILLRQKDNEIDNNQKLWNAISKLSIEDIAKVYEELGWQGDLMEYASNLKKQNEKKI